MLALEHEFSRAVVIEFLLRPCCLVMTRFTALAIFTLVNIVGAVTGDTLGF